MKSFHLIAGFAFLLASICYVLATEDFDKDVVFIGKKPHQQHHDKMEHLALFNHFLDKYNKSYDTKEEYHRRLRIFRANLKKIEILQETEQGTATYGPKLVDCDKVDAGCNGGLMTNAFETIMNKLGGGLEGEKDYPYKGSNKACNLDKTEIRAKISNYVNVSRDETDMAKFLVDNGPLAVALNANAMQFYFGGVSHPLKFLCKGGVDNLDHGVLIVGYGVHTTSILHKVKPYWIIKNSWSTHWGEQVSYTFIITKSVSIPLQAILCSTRQCPSGVLRTVGVTSGENR
ncbi:hypothetical protein WDU94_013521 [Cyamophila willieti]